MKYKIQWSYKYCFSNKKVFQIHAQLWVYFILYTGNVFQNITLKGNIVVPIPLYESMSITNVPIIDQWTFD